MLIYEEIWSIVLTLISSIAIAPIGEPELDPNSKLNLEIAFKLIVESLLSKLSNGIWWFCESV